MLNRKLILGSWIVAISLLAGPALADVAGKWEGQVETPVGMVKYTYDLQLKGKELAGKVTRVTTDDPAGKTSDLKDIKVTGDDVSFTEMLDLQGQQIEVKYKGKVTGDEMKLNRSVGDFGAQDFTAKRAKATTMPAKP
jgi:hypothetical protein